MGLGRAGSGGVLVVHEQSDFPGDLGCGMASGGWGLLQEMWNGVGWLGLGDLHVGVTSGDLTITYCIISSYLCY